MDMQKMLHELETEYTRIGQLLAVMRPMAAASGGVVVKRRPGRPRYATAADVQPVVQKRRPGRPRVRPLPEPQA